jgi:hypothetical protein
MTEGGVGWPQALDHLERSVEQAASALAAGEGPPAAEPAWTPPSGLGPLTDELRDRAELLAERIAALERIALRRHGELRDELEDLGRRRGAGAAYAAAGPASPDRPPCEPPASRS